MTDRDSILTTAREELYTAVIADTLDSLGLHRQVVAPGLAPLEETMAICGFARVGLYMPIYHDDATVSTKSG